MPLVIASRQRPQFCASQRVLELGAGDGLLLVAVVLISFLFVVLGGNAGNVAIAVLSGLMSTAFVV